MMGESDPVTEVGIVERSRLYLQPIRLSLQQASVPPGRGGLGWVEVRDAHDEATQRRWQNPSWAYAEVEGR